jgi:hypothetical protein
MKERATLDKFIPGTLTADVVQLKQDLKEMAKKYRNLRNEIQDKVTFSKDLHRLEVWKALTVLRKKFYDDVEKIIENEIGFTLKKVREMGDYYEYQHDKDPKKRALDNTADWVQEYIKKGGDEATLLKTAAESRIRALRATFNRKTRTSKSDDTKVNKKVGKSKASATTSGDAKASATMTKAVG